ncbi:MAG: Ig-like domain-containing protein, partial [Wenzhouxiangella sp.]|nr:Ig-like domain-containing protein [Wenzhouxiangella sp.]
PPTLSNPGHQTLDEDGSLGPLPFTIGDPETPAADLAMTATSDNPALFPPGSLALAGSGESRSLTLSPAANAFGSAMVTLSVTDTDGAVASESFQVVVNSVNDLPELGTLAAASTDEDQPLSITVPISDVETALADLTLDVTSSDPALFPPGSASWNLNGADPVLTLTPAADAFGSASVSLTVTDTDGGSSSTSFEVTVNPVADAPRGLDPSYAIDAGEVLLLAATDLATDPDPGSALAISSVNGQEWHDGQVVLYSGAVTDRFDFAQILTASASPEGATRPWQESDFPDFPQPADYTGDGFAAAVRNFFLNNNLLPLQEYYENDPTYYIDLNIFRENNQTAPGFQMSNPGGFPMEVAVTPDAQGRLRFQLPPSLYEHLAVGQSETLQLQVGIVDNDGLIGNSTVSITVTRPATAAPIARQRWYGGWEHASYTARLSQDVQAPGGGPVTVTHVNDVALTTGATITSPAGTTFTVNADGDLEFSIDHFNAAPPIAYQGTLAGQPKTLSEIAPDQVDRLMLTVVDDQGQSHQIPYEIRFLYELGELYANCSTFETSHFNFGYIGPVTQPAAGSALRYISDAATTDFHAPFSGVFRAVTPFGGILNLSARSVPFATDPDGFTAYRNASGSIDVICQSFLDNISIEPLCRSEALTSFRITNNNDEAIVVNVGSAGTPVPVGALSSNEMETA